MSQDASRDHADRKITHIVYCAIYQRTLRFACRRCPHVALLDSVPVWWLFERKGWDGRVGQLPRRFYCSKCWAAHRRRVRPTVTITEGLPEGEQFAYPDEREWKKLVSRQRG